MFAWVIGSGGMLGSAVARVSDKAGADLFAASPVPWADESAAGRVLADDMRRFAEEAGDRDWSVIWAAGTSVVASAPEATNRELRVLHAFTTDVARVRPGGRGALFLTSSAGGVYAGSIRPPFDSGTVPRPISPYGHLKLAQEREATVALAGRVPLVIGRFSNLYGPDQDTGKRQGLIPLLCRAALLRRPLNLYVPMDTVRDYLYVDDAARMVWHEVRSAIEDQPAEPRIAILGSGQATTVAEVVATVQNVAHRRVPLALGTDPSARHQATDLRLVPSVRRADLTPLPNGIKRVLDASAGRSG